MSEYKWTTGIDGITGTSHTQTGAGEIPWSFFCNFMNIPVGTDLNQGVCEANQTDMIKTLMDAWVQSKTVTITGNDEQAPAPYIRIESVKIT